MKKFIMFIMLFLMAAFSLPTSIYANNESGVMVEPPPKPYGDEMEPPPKPPGDEMEPPPEENVEIDYKGVTLFTETISESNKEYVSTDDKKIALLVSGGSNRISNCSVIKSGNDDSEYANFYGTNAAILVYNEGVLDIQKCNITTTGEYANGVFAYGKGIVTISNTKINTKSNDSGGVMVTGGGTLTATDLDIKTIGVSSAAIRSDRGGGKISIIGGTYETNGMGSPVIYSTAEITVDNAKLISNSAEGIVIEGNNSVKLNNVDLVDTNNTLYDLSETYKNIFIYQSINLIINNNLSLFEAKDSTIETNNGDTIFVTNTNAQIVLENNKIINKNGDFLRIQVGKWGVNGYNGGNVVLSLINQKVEGNIIVDHFSTLELSLSKNSLLIGSIDSDNEAISIGLKLSKDSTFVLTNDSYLTSLENEMSDNSNIYLEGHKLYIGGVEIKGNNNKFNKNNKTSIYVILIVGIVTIIGILLKQIIGKKL